MEDDYDAILPTDFKKYVTVDPETGCWLWSGRVTLSGYPSYKRRAAWRWAYEQVFGTLKPFSQYPTIETCKVDECAYPEHRLDLPRDQATRAHKCWCGKIHRPD